MRSRVREKREQGVVLVLVLWILVLLSVMAVTLRANQKTEVALSIGQQYQSQGRALAQGAVNYAIARLLAVENDDQESIDAVDWLPNGEPNAWHFQGIESTVRISAERGRININLANAEMLRQLMETVGIPAKEIPELVGAIQDWRDANDAAMSPGAEDAEYRLMGKTYGAKDGRFSSIRELKLLPGMRKEYYTAMAPALTVYSTKQAVDASLALPLVLEVLAEEAEILNPLQEERLRIPRGFYRMQIEIAFPEDDLYSTEAIVDFNRAYKGGYRIVQWIYNRPTQPTVPVTSG